MSEITVTAATLVYRHYEIRVVSAPSVTGDPLFAWSISRRSDGYMVDGGHSYESTDPQLYAEYLKQRVDTELAKEFPWMEVKYNG